MSPRLRRRSWDKVLSPQGPFRREDSRREASGSREGEARCWAELWGGIGVLVAGSLLVNKFKGLRVTERVRLCVGQL